MRKLIFIILIAMTSCSNVKLGMRCYDHLGDNQWHLVSINDKYPNYFTIQAMPEGTKLDQIVELKVPKDELEPK